MKWINQAEIPGSISETWNKQITSDTGNKKTDVSLQHNQYQVFHSAYDGIIHIGSSIKIYHFQT